MFSGFFNCLNIRKEEEKRGSQKVVGYKLPTRGRQVGYNKS